MAHFWLPLWMLLWSLLTAGSFRLPTLRLFIKDGAPVDHVESYNLPAKAGSWSASPGQWVWKRAGDDGQESPQLPCRKKDGGSRCLPKTTTEEAKNSLTLMETAAESSTSVGKYYNGATAEVSTNATITLDTSGKVSTEVATTREVIHLSTTTNSFQAPVPRVRRLAPTGGRTVSQSMPTGIEKAAKALPKTMMGLGVPEKQLVGATSSQSMVATSDVSTAKLKEAIGTTRPPFIIKGKVKFPHSTAMPSSTTEWLLDDMTTSQSLVATSDVSTPKLRQAVGTTGLSLIAKGKVKFPHSTAMPSSTTEWLLDDMTTSQSLVATSDVSTPKLRQAVGTTGLSLIAKGKVKFPHSTAMPSSTTEWLLDDMTTSQSMVATSDVSTAKLRQAVGTTRLPFIAKFTIPATMTTAKVKPPSAKSLNGTTILVGKCLLWIFILALIAGIFIVATGVLATMLWRQKRAYKMNEHNHTEMVCISSLLAAEEAEEAGGRHPRAKRVKRLGENGSEVDMDNLTLNSFLPEH